MRSELDITSVDDGWRNQEIIQLDFKAMWDCIDNARDIKNKIVELKANANVPGINVGASPVTNGEAEKEAQHRHPWHNMLRNATKKHRDLKSKDCQDRTDQEIRVNLLNSKDCEKELDDLLTSKEAIKQDSIGVSVDDHTKNAFEAELHDAIDMDTNKSAVEIKVDNDVKKPTLKTIILSDPDSCPKVQEIVNQEENKRRKSRY